MRSGIGNLRRKVQKQKWLIGAVGIVLALALVLGARIYASSVTIQQVEFQQEDGIYLVETEAQLLALGGATKDETAGKSFRLTKDIAVTSLGTAQKGTFAGTLDGDGHMVTYKNVNIISQDDQAGKVTINEGILFGALTTEGIIENLFLNIGSISYAFENTAAEVVEGGTVTMDDYSGSLYNTTNEEGKTNILALPRYVKENGNYVEDTSKIVFQEGETKTFYYKQELSVDVNKDTVITTKNGKIVRFGVVCGENQGTIQNVEVRGEAVNAEIKDDSYTITDSYDETQVTIEQYYKVVMTADKGTTVQVTEAGERATGTYFYLYWKKDTGYDYTTPLYLRDGNGSFDLTQPLYETTEGDETKFDLSKPIERGRDTAAVHDGESAEISTTNPGDTKIAVSQADVEGNQRYLYAYDASKEYADLTTPLYQKALESWNMSSPIYFETLKSDGTAAFDLNHRLADLDLVLVKADGEKTEEVIKKDADGSYYYLYWRKDNAYDYSVPLYARKSNGEFDLTQPLYEKSADGKNYDLTKRSIAGETANAPIQASGSTAPIKPFESLAVSATDSSYKYLYAYHDNYADFTMPLYKGTTADMTEAVYASVVVTEDGSKSNYFNTEEKVKLVPRKASGTVSATAETVQTEEAVSCYLYRWDSTEKTWDFTRPLYARAADGSFDLTKPLYAYNTGVDSEYDLTQLTQHGQDANALIYVGTMAKLATSENNTGMGITEQNYAEAVLDSNHYYRYAYHDGYVDLSKPLYTGNGTAFADAQYELVTDAEGNQYFNLEQKQELVPAMADSAVTAEVIKKGNGSSRGRRWNSRRRVLLFILVQWNYFGLYSSSVCKRRGWKL